MSTARVDFTRGAAERIARVVRIVETGERGQAPLTFRKPADELAGGAQLRLGRTGNSSWFKNTLATITLYPEGEALSEETADPSTSLSAVNKLADVAANRWVVLGRMNGRWYLIAAEC